MTSQISILLFFVINIKYFLSWLDICPFPIDLWSNNLFFFQLFRTSTQTFILIIYESDPHPSIAGPRCLLQGPFLHRWHTTRLSSLRRLAIASARATARYEGSTHQASHPSSTCRSIAHHGSASTLQIGKDRTLVLISLFYLQMPISISKARQSFVDMHQKGWIECLQQQKKAWFLRWGKQWIKC